MSDKPVAIFTTWVVLTPVMAVCCLGTVFLGSALAGAWAWLVGGAGLPTAAATAIVAALALYGFRQRRRRRRRPGRKPDGSRAPSADLRGDHHRLSWRRP